MTEKRMPYITDAQTKAAHDLMMSETMQRLCAMADGLDMNPTDPANIKTALATTGMSVIRGLDHGRIHFDDEHDKIMLFGLLVVAMEIVMDGEFASGLTRQTVMMQ
ncbi:hypothetical protein CCR95_16915 [Thiocystis minor]|uniref:hypothetical protein n=1 Tax=Thiocystis minor TaxID=61597 RepID=UPI00191156F9|nr:hypothetical protein [Thiocystis minor]MBK5965716.1 hypothetical protein [Thiocystis minor]